MNHHSFLSRFFEGLRRGITDLWFILSVVVSVTLFLLLVSYHVTDPAWNTSGTNEGVRNWLGGFGAYTADILITSFGYAIYLLPLGILWIGWESVRNRYANIEILIWKLLGLVVTIIVSCGILSIHWPSKINSLAVTTGGYLGQKMSVALLGQLSIQWVMLIYTLFFILGFTLLFELNWLKCVDKIGYVIINSAKWLRDKLKNKDSRPQWSEHAEGYKNKRSRLKQKLEPGMNVNQDLDNEDYLSASDYSQELRWSDYKQQTIDKKTATAPESINGQDSHTARHENTLNQSFDSQEIDYDLPQSQSTHQVPQNNIFSNVDNGEDIAKQFTDTNVSLQTRDDQHLTLDNVQSNLNHSHNRANNLSVALPSVDENESVEVPETVHFDENGQDYSNSDYINDHAIENDTKKLKVSLIGNPFNKQDNAINKQDNAITIENDHDGNYQLPPLNILSLAPVSYTEYTQEQLLAMAETVQDALKNYKIEATVVNIQVGPVVTRLELDLAPGIKVSQISNLDKDLARSLSVRSVRVVEVIPGKPYIGLEIPNKDRETVHLRNILESDEYRKIKSPLTVVLGVDIGGQPIVDNLEKMPHLLVAGTTGSGKSVAINVMLASMLYKATPEDLRLILIDPKMLEMSMYEDIPHLLTPVVTDMNDAENALRWAVAEMERRYELMAAFRVRNIAGFNQVIREKQSRNERVDDPLWNPEDFLGLAHQPPQINPLPMIVIVIDELADMMMAVGKKVEELIARIAQKARAAGIHLILATQRPSVDVITGLIKANIPGRLAFQVSSKIDSRTILDQQGAETLLGYGDGLFFPPRSSQPQRIHGALIEDVEVDKLTQFIKSQGKPDYEESITNPVPGAAMGAFGANEKSNDPTQDTLYDEACQLVIEEGKASISWLQRRLSIGYNRSARLMESMEEAGIVSAPERSGSRRLLVGPHSGSDK